MDFHSCSNNSIMSELYCKDCSTHVGETRSKPGVIKQEGRGKDTRDFVSEAVYIYIHINVLRAEEHDTLVLLSNIMLI